MNRWEGSRLRWYHKKGYSFDSPTVKGMLGGTRVHVFWRRSKAERFFTYAGLATAEKVDPTSSPVEFLWSFGRP